MVLIHLAIGRPAHNSDCNKELNVGTAPAIIRHVQRKKQNPFSIGVTVMAEVGVRLMVVSGMSGWGMCAPGRLSRACGRVVWSSRRL